MVDFCRVGPWVAITGLCASTLLAASGCEYVPQTVEAPKRSLAVTGAGAALERLTTEPTTERRPQISPDGHILLFQVTVYESDTSDLIKQEVLNGVNPNTRANRTVYTSTNCLSNGPAWLPDQSSYVYASNASGAWGLVRALSAAPNAAVSVVAAGDIAPGASWPAVSPDGSRVAFSVEVRGVRNIGIIGIDGSRFTLLGEGNMPSWSPDGQTLAFVRTVNGYDQLFLVNAADGTGLVQLTTGEVRNDFPSWSPDGQYIVFSSNRGWNRYSYASEKSVFNLHLCKRDGTGVTQLTEGDTIATDPNWGRDGWIYFASNQGGSFDIWRLKATGVSMGPIVTPPTAPAPTPPTPATAPTAPGTSPPPPVEGGCTKDVDCKGNRVCEQGVCVSPTK